jgi:hypothetical protein
MYILLSLLESESQKENLIRMLKIKLMHKIKYGHFCYDNNKRHICFSHSNINSNIEGIFLSSILHEFPVYIIYLPIYTTWSTLTLRCCFIALLMICQNVTWLLRALYGFWMSLPLYILMQPRLSDEYLTKHIYKNWSTNRNDIIIVLKIPRVLLYSYCFLYFVHEAYHESHKML